MDKFFVYTESMSVKDFIEVLQQLPENFIIKADGERDFDDWNCYLNIDSKNGTVVFSSTDLYHEEVFLEDLDEDFFCDEDEEDGI